MERKRDPIRPHVPTGPILPSRPTRRRRSPRRAASALTALLLLTGCSAGPEVTEEPAPSSSSASATADGPEGSPSPEAEPTGQEWADAVMTGWFTAEGVDDAGDFPAPFHHIRSWDSTVPGELEITVDPDITAQDETYLEGTGPANDLWMIAGVGFDSMACAVPELQAVVARTADGERTEKVTRADFDARNGARAGDGPDLIHSLRGQSWADEAVSRWFDAQGVDGPEGFVHPADKVLRWDSPRTGVLELVVHPDITETDEVYLEDQGPANDLHLIVALAMQDLYPRVPGLVEITARTADGERTETITVKEHAEQLGEPLSCP